MAKIEMKGEHQILITFNNSSSCNFYIKKIRELLTNVDESNPENTDTEPITHEIRKVKNVE